MADEVHPTSIDDAEFAAELAEEEATTEGESAKQSLTKAEMADQSRKQAEQLVEIMRGHSDQLDTIGRSHGDLLERLSNVVGAGDVETDWDLADKEMRQHIRQLEESLANLKQGDGQLNAERQNIAREVRQWVGDQKFDQLQSEIIRQFRGFDEAQLEEQVERLLDQLTLRLTTIEQKLAEIGLNRNQLVSELQAIADDGHSVLRSAANQSRLPDSVPELAGSQFLSISLSWPEDPTEVRGRLADLIDELVEADKIPSGLELIQAAVRRLARPVRARVLNPDPNHHGQRLEISDLAKFSGGERLTCAVLLYCVMGRPKPATPGRVENRPILRSSDLPLAFRVSAREECDGESTQHGQSQRNFSLTSIRPLQPADLQAAGR